MITKVHFFFGPSIHSSALSFDPGPITVIVGPNNSGKSLALQELEVICQGSEPQGRMIINGIDLKRFPEAEARSLLDERIDQEATAQLPKGQARVSSVQPSRGLTQTTITLEDTVASLIAGTNEQIIRAHVCRHYTVRLDGHTRLSLVTPQGTSDLQERPQNVLHALFKDDHARLSIRNIIREAFDLSFVIDPTGMREFRVRLSERDPVDTEEEQGLSSRSREFHRNAKEITEYSDGVRAFTGLVAAVLASDYRIMLIDEPEAFLHPPLARRLGKTLAEVATQRSGHVFAATHSPPFLIGAVESGAPVNVVRLTYEKGVATARLLAASELRVMMLDPLLRSTELLNALFHRSAVVCEGDRDRAFYQEINLRLLSAGRDGIRDTVFINAHSAQEERRLSGPLREMGIPAAIIVDLDLIKDGGAFRDLLRDSFLPPAVAGSLGMLRGDVLRRFQGAEVEPADGPSRLPPAAQDEVKSLVDQCAHYGIFLVPVGEVEDWLGDLELNVTKNRWLIEAFKSMGSDPDSSEYLRPQSGDVWSFLERVSAWVEDPERDGMPRTSAEST